MYVCMYVCVVPQTNSADVEDRSFFETRSNAEENNGEVVQLIEVKCLINTLSDRFEMLVKPHCLVNGTLWCDGMWYQGGS